MREGEKAHVVEIQIKKLTQRYGLVLGLVQQIQLSIVQSTALYGAKLWWKNQKNYKHNIQQLFNCQARSIIEMYFSTLLYPLLCEPGLILVSIYLNYCQRSYAHRLLSLQDQHPVKEILPVSLKKRDGGYQPGKLLENILIWTQNI